MSEQTKDHFQVWAWMVLVAGLFAALVALFADGYWAMLWTLAVLSVGLWLGYLFGEIKYKHRAIALDKAADRLREGLEKIEARMNEQSHE